MPRYDDRVMTTVLYPGSFDPPTLGHIDLIRRAVAAFGRVKVAIAENSTKTAIFSVAERIALLEKSLAEVDQRGALAQVVEVTSFAGLVVDYCRQNGHKLILRGVRNAADLEFEKQMAFTNRQMNPDVDTVFMAPSLEYSATSSTLIKEIARHGGDVSRWLPKAVITALHTKLCK